MLLSTNLKNEKKVENLLTQIKNLIARVNIQIKIEIL